MKKIFFTLLFLLGVTFNICYASTFTVNSEEEFKTKLFDEFRRGEKYIKIYINNFKEMDADYIQNVLNSVVDDEEINWKCYLKELGFSVSENPYAVEINKIDYAVTDEEREFVNKEIDRILSEILKPNMTTLEKEIAIHDWIISNVEYDKTRTRTRPYQALTGSKKAVCIGYSLLTYEMLDKVGIPCRIALGKVSGGEEHAWNMVNIDGNWYHLDTTFDNPHNTNNTKNWNVCRVGYLNATDEQIKKDHIWYNDLPKSAPVSISKLHSMNLKNKEVWVNVGQVIVPKLEFYPQTAINKDVSYAIPDDGIIYMTYDEKTGKDTLYAHKVGTTKIRIISDDGNFMQDMIVHVGAPANSISLNKTNVTLKKGGFVSIIAKVNPSNAYSNELIWESSDSKIARVDKNGKISGVGKGKTTIKVKLKYKPSIYKILNVTVQ
ncbi:Ig-like domain-containing protein [Fervidicella metallireducens]|nr:Ig-like domain-containing protein [Fervidicella metallireducens]